MTTAIPRQIRRVDAQPSLLLWGYLLLITSAEYVTSVVHPQLGLILHALALAGLVFHAGVAQNSNLRKMAVALTLAPLIRLLSLSLPLPNFPQLNWYPLVSLPLLLTLWLIVRQTNLSRQELGLRAGKLAIQMLLACAGFGLGAMEYAILQPAPLIRPFTMASLVYATLILLVFTGFTEEIVFRGLLQSLAIPALGRGALVYVALLFAVLHIGYLSVLDVVFVFGVGIVFAYIAYWGKSILGVTLAHGLTNTFLFLILPYAAEDGAGGFQQATSWIIWIGSALGLLGVGVLMWQARRDGRLTPGDVVDVARQSARLERQHRWRRPVPRRKTPFRPVSRQYTAHPPIRRSAPDPDELAPSAPIVALASDTAAALSPTARPVIHLPRLWSDPQSMPGTETCAALYRQLSGNPHPPLLHAHVATRTPAVVSAILFVPSKHKGAKHIAVSDGTIHCYYDGRCMRIPSGRLLSAQFRYVEGVVHIGLGIAGTSDRTYRYQPDTWRIGRMLSKRLTQELSLLAEQQPAVFRSFWAEFGAYFDDAQARRQDAA